MKRFLSPQSQKKKSQKKKRIMVDMSVTLLHHGHIRILKKASHYGQVIVALTKDKEIKKFKGYKTEMNFFQRKEILESIRYVHSVVPSNFIINNKNGFLAKNYAEWKKNLIELIDDSDKRAKIGLEAKKTFNEKFDFDKNHKKYLDVLSIK